MGNLQELSDLKKTIKISARRFEESPYIERTYSPEMVRGVYAGRYFPMTIGEDPLKKYWLLRQKALIFDVPEKPIEISGPDTIPFLEKVMTRKVSTIKEGRGYYSLACTPQGGIFMDGVLFKFEENKFWYVQADGPFEDWLTAHSSNFNVKISDPKSRVLQIQGPASVDIMKDASQGKIDENMKYFRSGFFNLGGQTLYVSRTGFTNEVGFEIEYRAFEKLPYPPCLNSVEERNKYNYLVSNSYTETTELEYESVAAARYLEIYRLDYRPTNYKQFDGARISFIDLKNYKAMADYDPSDDPIIESFAGDKADFPSAASSSPPPPRPGLVLKDISVAPEAIFYDTVQPNKKYYYAMRFLNEREEPGQFSAVYKTELIDDGGYLYPVFDTIYPKDLNPDRMVNPTKDFKKLFNLTPNIQHLLFNDEGVDYSKPAYSQKEKIKVGLVEEPIWDKTFKIRLTSKKTGKKIDLNITYKLSRG